MNKPEYKDFLDSFIKDAKVNACEPDQDRMIDEFYSRELDRLQLFAENETVGYKEELRMAASYFQSVWTYANNAHTFPVF